MHTGISIVATYEILKIKKPTGKNASALSQLVLPALSVTIQKYFLFETSKGYQINFYTSIDILHKKVVLILCNIL